MDTNSYRRRISTNAAGRFLVVNILLLYAVLVSPSQADLTVTAQTTECNGATGFASFTIDRLYKIQEGPCPDPTDPSRNLKQVLLKDPTYQFQVLWVTESESQQLLKQINEIKSARLQDLTKPEVVIERTVVERTEVIQESAVKPSAEVAPDDAPGDREPAGDPPKIELIDPPLGNTRSLNQIVTASDTEIRTLVGKARAGSGILSLTVNGEQQTVDEQGIFTAEIPVKSGRTPVTIVAVDKSGRNSTVDLELIREAPEGSTSDSGVTGEAGIEVFGSYHALIIANNDYESLMDLSTPVNDANAVAELLRDRYGFEVTMLLDATRYDLLTALNDMRRQLTDKDNLLIYFAGHGAYDKVNNRGHWLPVDAESDSTANWISTIEITDIVNAMSAMHVLVVADSCYSGALNRSENTDLDPGMSPELRAQWLRAMAEAKSRHVLTSGGVKPVVDDAGNGHSIFANAFITALQEGDGAVESSELFRKVEERVADRARELALDQIPQYAQLKNTGHEFGEFILVTRRFELSGQSQKQTDE